MSKRKSLKCASKSENLNGVTSQATKKLAEEILAMENEINLDFLNASETADLASVEEEGILLKRSRFMFLGPRNSHFDSAKFGFPTSQPTEEVHLALLTCIDDNMLGKWSINNEKPFTSEMIDNLVCMCLLENKDLGFSATEYFLTVFRQMIAVSAQVPLDWIFSLKLFQSCLSEFSVHCIVGNPLSATTVSMDSDSSIEKDRDPAWINTDGFLSFLQILETVFRAYCEHCVLLLRHNSDIIRKDLVEMIRVLLILSCDETVKDAICFALREVVNLMLLICSDFEYLDDPDSAMECDPFRYHCSDSDDSSMRSMLSRMIRSIVENPDLDLRTLCAMDIENVALQCYLYDTVLGSRYRFKKFDDVTQMVVDNWTIKKSGTLSIAVKVVTFVSALLDVIDENIDVLIKHSMWLHAVYDVILFYITGSIHWWSHSEKILRQLLGIIEEIEQIYNKRQHDAKITENTKCIRIVIDKALMML